MLKLDPQTLGELMTTEYAGAQERRSVMSTSYILHHPDDKSAPRAAPCDLAPPMNRVSRPWRAIRAMLKWLERPNYFAPMGFGRSRQPSFRAWLVGTCVRGSQGVREGLWGLLMPPPLPSIWSKAGATEFLSWFTL